MKLDEARRDYYRKRAREEGYESRAAYKLLEAIKKYRLIKRPADVLLSDLSPKISGAWDLDQYRQIDLTITSITIGDTLLRAGGNSMFKCFQGERFSEAEKEARQRYNFVAIMKPHASRNASSEMYLLCLGRRP